MSDISCAEIPLLNLRPCHPVAGRYPIFDEADPTPTQFKNQANSIKNGETRSGSCFMEIHPVKKAEDAEICRVCCVFLDFRLNSVILVPIKVGKSERQGGAFPWNKDRIIVWRTVVRVAFADG